MLDTPTLDSIYSMAQIVEGVAQGTNLAKFHAGLEAVARAQAAETRREVSGELRLLKQHIQNPVSVKAVLGCIQAATLHFDAFPETSSLHPQKQIQVALEAALKDAHYSFIAPLQAALELERSAREEDGAALRRMVDAHSGIEVDTPDARCIYCKATSPRMEFDAESAATRIDHKPDCPREAALRALGEGKQNSKA